MSHDDHKHDPAEGAQQTSRRGKKGRKKARKQSAAAGGVFATAVNDINRLREIVLVLARHGFHQFIKQGGLDKIVGGRIDLPTNADPVDPTDSRGMARRLRLVLEDLGTTFIKLGQILSTRADLLPQAYIQEFEKLQDRVPPMPFALVRAQIEAGLGGPLEQFYASVETESIATASIGQVHGAITVEGREVVVKVQRDGVAAQIRSDLDLLYLLARLLEATIEEMELYSISDIVREFDRAIQQEIDFAHEARNVRIFRRNFEDDPHVVVPEVVESLSCRTILTLERLHGSKLTDLDNNDPGARRLLELLMEATYRQIFDFGFVHADPHPGNVLVLGPETLGFIDFGLVCRLSRAQQDDVVTLFLSILSNDVDGIARTLLRMGVPKGRVSLTEFRREVTRVRDKYINLNLNEVDVAAFSQEAMDAAMRFQIKLNPEYSLLVKATVTVEGIMRRVDPEMDLLKTAQPYARRLILDRYSSRNILQNVFTGAMSLSGFLRDVPQQLDQVLMDLESGTVSVNIRNPQLDDLGGQLTHLGTRICLGLLGAGLTVGACIMFAQLDYRPWDVPVLLFIALFVLLLAIVVGAIGLLFPLLTPRTRRVRVGPLLQLLTRKHDR